MPVPTTFGIVSRTNLATTWNPSDKGANITLSGGNMVATTTGAGLVRATLGRSTGKYYFEAQRPSGFAPMRIGLATPSASLSTNVGAAGSVGGENPDIRMNSTTVGATGALSSEGDWCAVAVDLDARRLWMRDPTNGWSGVTLGGGNPAAGTGGVDISTLTGFLYPATGWSASGRSILVNFGATAFFWTPPAGFSAWNG